MLKPSTRSACGMGRPGEIVAPLARQRPAGSTCLGDPGQHADRALVEPEVVHRTGHLAVLDQVHPVPGQPGQQQGLRIDRPDVPQAGQQQAAAGPADHVGQRRVTHATGGIGSRFHDQVVDARCHRLAGECGRVPGLYQGAERAAVQPVGPGQRQPVVKCRGAPARRVCQDERRAFESGRRRVAVQRQRQAGEVLADPGAAARLAEHGVRPSGGSVPGVGRPVHGHRSGRPPRSAAAASRTGQPGAPPGAEPQLSRCDSLGCQRLDINIGEVPGTGTVPGRRGQVGRFGGQFQAAGRLIVPQPQPGRGAQVDRAQLVLGEPVEPLPPAPPQRWRRRCRGGQRSH